MATIYHQPPFFTPHPKPHSPAKTTTSTIYCSKSNNPDPFKEKKQAQSDLPKRHRLRVEGDRFQKDWTVSEVVERIIKLNHWEDVEGVLNSWAGRFARKNFPVLIRELTNMGSIDIVSKFSRMKNQKDYCARNDIYDMMIRLHARHNRIDQARGLFFEMQKGCKPDVETYNALIYAHGRADKFQPLLTTLFLFPHTVNLCACIFHFSCIGCTAFTRNKFDVVSNLQIPPSRSTYNNLINACGSSGNWREALKVCKKMTDNGVGPDLVTHNIILSAYKTGSQYSKALSYFELMRGTNVHPDTTTLNIVIGCLVKLGKYEEAIKVFNSMREKRSECRPDIVTYTSIMHMYSVCGQGLKPNIVSYNALLGAYASLGLSESASSIFNEMKQNGIRPDVISYTSLLNAFGRSQQPQKAREIFDDEKKQLQTEFAEAVELLREMEQVGLQPNVVSISSLLAACGRCCQKVKIDSILKAANLRGIELNTIAYNSAIGSYMNVGEYEQALALYRRMREKRVKPDSVTYNVLISGCCKLSKYSEAVEFLVELRDLKIPLSKEVYSSAICAYSKQATESMFNMMKMDGSHPDVIAYTAMLHAYSTAEHWEKAFAVFQEMELNNVQPDSVACAALMRTFNRGSQPGKVLLLAEFMRDKKIPFIDAVFFEMVSACTILRDWKTLTDVIHMMETSLPRISVGTLNHLLHSFGKVGKIDTMTKLFLKIVASGAEVDSTTYAVLLKSLLTAGYWRKYIEVMQWMEDAGVPPSAQMYSSILSFAQTSGGLKMLQP
ncbi:hypothetical protein Pfo_028257 [Paulownia fortunei]|nr:hypothetical protein Pfo_028257 [Paulownia fortunei]